MLAVCTDETVLGVPFYVMEFLDGEVVTDEIPSALASPAARRATGHALVDLLAQLHRVPVDGPAAQALGRPVGYLSRQVERFGSLWSGNTTRDLPAVERLGKWLAAELPETQAAAVVHGDYRMGNLMFAAGGSAPGAGTAGLGDGHPRRSAGRPRLPGRRPTPNPVGRPR